MVSNGMILARDRTGSTSGLQFNKGDRIRILKVKKVDLLGDLDCKIYNFNDGVVYNKVYIALRRWNVLGMSTIKVGGEIL